MPDQPLSPFSPPTELLAQLHLTGFVSSGNLIVWVLYFAFFIWAVYTLVAIYHWIKYSHASLVALPAIGAHLFVSFALITYALSGTGFFATYLP